MINNYAQSQVHRKDQDDQSKDIQNEVEGDDTYSKYSSYDLDVDSSQGNKAKEFKLFSLKRPHMRAFHFSWWSYHVAFLMWFSISPLLKEVQETLDISDAEIWNSSISAVSGTIIMRFILGPFCDKFGPRIPMGIILLVSAIPTAMIGLVETSAGLATIRFFIGIGGSTFVMCQYWTTSMFTRERVGTANATVGGWGNLGGGVTQILVGSFLFPVLRAAYGGDSEKAWRTACILPAILGMITAYGVIRYSDDSPKGNFSKLKKLDKMENVGIWQVFKSGAQNANTWILFLQYACCFGVEITMNNAAALYFGERFNLSTEKAAAVASIFGWMNIFARGLGGFLSDKMNSKYGLRGRLWWQSFVLFFEGVMVILFAHCIDLQTSIVSLIFFSIFVQAAEGSTYGIVPYVNPPVTGSISGIIGAGGNVGAVVFSLCFRELDATKAFVVMGSMIVASSTLSALIKIDGHVGYMFQPADNATAVVTGGKTTTCLDESVTRTDSDGGSPRSSTVRILTGIDAYPAIHV